MSARNLPRTKAPLSEKDAAIAERIMDAVTPSQVADALNALVRRNGTDRVLAAVLEWVESLPQDAP